MFVNGIDRKVIHGDRLLLVLREDRLGAEGSVGGPEGEGTGRLRGGLCVVGTVPHVKRVGDTPCSGAFSGPQAEVFGIAMVFHEARIFE